MTNRKKLRIGVTVMGVDKINICIINVKETRGKKKKNSKNSEDKHVKILLPYILLFPCYQQKLLTAR